MKGGDAKIPLKFRPRVRKENKNMTSIQKYKNKKGETLYKFQAYLGVNPQTGKKKVTRRNGFKTKREAELELSRLQSKFENSPTASQNNITFAEVYEQWYPTYINTVRVSTYARTQAMFDNHIIPAFGDKRIRTITIDDVQKAVNKWFKIAPVSGYKRWYQYTCNVIDFAIRRQYMTGNNPAKAITLPKRKINPGDEPENYWDREQLKTFMELIKDGEQYTLFRTLAYSGIRRGECLALTWEDINFESGEIRVNKTLTQGERGETIVQPPKTKAGYRSVPLDDETLNTLKKWRKQQMSLFLKAGINTMNKNQLVFSNRKNGFKGLNTPAKWLNSYIKDYDLKPITVHGLRKTYCTALVSAGLPIKEIQRRMGHDDVQTTLDVYSFVTKDEIQKATDKFEKYITG